MIGESGKPGNKYKHLITHKDCVEWSRLYEICKAENLPKPEKSTDKKHLSLVKFFKTSNLAMEALENKHLLDLINSKLSKYLFKNIVLHNMMMNDEIFIRYNF